MSAAEWETCKVCFFYLVIAFSMHSPCTLSWPKWFFSFCFSVTLFWWLCVCALCGCLCVYWYVWECVCSVCISQLSHFSNKQKYSEYAFSYVQRWHICFFLNEKEREKEKENRTEKKTLSKCLCFCSKWAIQWDSNVLGGGGGGWWKFEIIRKKR